MSKQRRKNWNPTVVAGKPFDITLEIPGEGSVSMTFAPTGLVDFFHDGKSSKGYSWQAPDALFKILATADNTHHGRLMHVSVSHPYILPPWPVMIAIKRHFFPEDVAAAMVMPEEEVYVNTHANCLHIWQLPVDWGIG